MKSEIKLYKLNTRTYDNIKTFVMVYESLKSLKYKNQMIDVMNDCNLPITTKENQDEIIKLILTLPDDVKIDVELKRTQYGNDAIYLIFDKQISAFVEYIVHVRDEHQESKSYAFTDPKEFDNFIKNNKIIIKPF